MPDEVLATARAARAASRKLAAASSEIRNRMLMTLANEIRSSSESLLAANARDISAAQSTGLKPSMIDRLCFTHAKLQQVIDSVSQVAALEDPAGRVLSRTTLDDGLVLEQISIPFGVIGAVLEARPDAVVQIVSLAIKSANALLLKAGAEMAETARTLAQIAARTLTLMGLPSETVSFFYSRSAVSEMLQLDEYIGLLVPRGSKDLIRYVQRNTRIPVIGHAEGICHVYIDRGADSEMAIRIALDSKTQSPSACNAAETILVHRAIAPELLPRLMANLRSAGVRVRGCAKTRDLLSDATIEIIEKDADWATEYGDLTVAIRIVDSLEDAVDHIAAYGSQHTDTIVTEDQQAADRFLSQVDSAGVYHNASTRFADGYRYGFGAEVGISTGKLPPRGPVGLQGLTTYKYVLRGRGHLVRDYVGPKARKFLHEVCV